MGRQIGDKGSLSGNGISCVQCIGSQWFSPLCRLWLCRRCPKRNRRLLRKDLARKRQVVLRALLHLERGTFESFRGGLARHHPGLWRSRPCRWHRDAVSVKRAPKTDIRLLLFESVPGVAW